MFEYINEELDKIRTNFFPLVFSGVTTLVVYSGVSSLFYFLWPTILSLKLGENLWYLRYLGPQIWKLTVVITLQLFCAYCYKVQPAFLEKYRYVKDWPWEVDKKAWNALLVKSLLNYVLNQLFISPIMFYYFMKFGEPLRADIFSWPNIWEILWNVTIFDFINDFILWFTHVLLHWKKIYPLIHKVHHEYIDVVSMSGEYFHPIEFVINSMGIIAGPKLFGARAHIVSYFIWQMTRVWDNIIQNHSGYMFPWRPLGICPFQNGNSFHYWHHDRNIGNYSFNYNFWDRMFGFDHKFQEAKKAGKIKFM